MKLVKLLKMFIYKLTEHTLVLARVFVKVSRPGDSEVTFSIFE